MLISQHWYSHVLESLWVHPCISSSVLLGWFVRWEAGGWTAAVLWDVASRTCSKQHIAFLYRSHLPFSYCILLVSIWCIHTEVMTQQKLGRNPFFVFSERSDFHMITYLSKAVHAFARCMLTLLSVDRILLPWYVYLSINFKGLPFRVEVFPSCLKHMNSVLFAFL